MSENLPALPRQDRRISRTRRQLREALMALILEKGYDAVTVEDIAARADVGRTTFYLHYRDKEHLFLESITQIADELAEQMYALFPQGQAVQEDQVGDHAMRPILLVFRHAAENADLYRAMMRGEGGLIAITRLRELAAGYALEFMRLFLKDAQTNLPLEVIASYFAASLLGMLTWWLEAGMPYPPDEMAHMFRRLAMRGVWEALGVTPPSSSAGQEKIQRLR